MALGRTLSDVNIILGGLLIFWSGLLELFLFFMYQEPAGCSARTSILLDGACYRTWFYLLIPAGIGIFLLTLASFARPSGASTQDLLRTDPYTMMALGCFLSVTLAAGGWLTYLAIDHAINNTVTGSFEVGGVNYGRINMLGVITGLAGITFLVGLLINLSHIAKRRRFLRGYTRAKQRKHRA